MAGQGLGRYICALGLLRALQATQEKGKSTQAPVSSAPSQNPPLLPYSATLVPGKDPNEDQSSPFKNVIPEDPKNQLRGSPHEKVHRSRPLGLLRHTHTLTHTLTYTHTLTWALTLDTVTLLATPSCVNVTCSWTESYTFTGEPYMDPNITLFHPDTITLEKSGIQSHIHTDAYKTPQYVHFHTHTATHSLTHTLPTLSHSHIHSRCPHALSHIKLSQPHSHSHSHIDYTFPWRHTGRGLFPHMVPQTFTTPQVHIHTLTHVHTHLRIHMLRGHMCRHGLLHMFTPHKRTLPHVGLLPPPSSQALPTLYAGGHIRPNRGAMFWFPFLSDEFHHKRDLPPPSPGKRPLSSRPAATPTPQSAPASAGVLALGPATQLSSEDRGGVLPPVLTSQNTACVRTALLEGVKFKGKKETPPNTRVSPRSLSLKYSRNLSASASFARGPRKSI